MNSLISMFAPPLLGAFIGYMTNFVAIRMLFRPLRPWRIFGFRLPMTPGIIPSKRLDLADNIGEMVGEHLLTKDDVSRALHGKRFELDMENLIKERVDNLLSHQFGDLYSIVPQRFRLFFKFSIKSMIRRLLLLFHKLMESDRFVNDLAETVSNRLDEFLEQTPKEIISSQHRSKLYELLEQNIARFLSSQESARWVRDFVNQKIDEILLEEKSIRDLVPEQVISIILDSFEQETPTILDETINFLFETKVRDRLIKGIRGLAANFRTPLDPLTSMATHVFNIDSIEQKVREYLYEKQSEISRSILDETMQKEVAEVLRKRLEQLLETPLCVHLKKMSQEDTIRLRQHLLEEIIRILRDPSAAKTLTAMFKDAIESRRNQSVQKMLYNLFGKSASTLSKQWFKDEIIVYVQSVHTKEKLDRVIKQFIQKQFISKPVGQLAAVIPERIKQAAVEHLMKMVKEFLIDEVPELIDSLDIRGIVVRKVNSLELLRLEKLLLGIMEEQFKYINLFGALLGFIIGLINLLFIF